MLNGRREATSTFFKYKLLEDKKSIFASFKLLGSVNIRFQGKLSQKLVRAWVRFPPGAGLSSSFLSYFVINY